MFQFQEDGGSRPLNEDREYVKKPRREASDEIRDAEAVNQVT